MASFASVSVRASALVAACLLTLAGVTGVAAGDASVGHGTSRLTPTATLASGCFTDDSQTDFQSGVPTGCDLVASPGSIVLASTENTDAQNTTVNAGGFAISSTTWAAQTFTPTVTGLLKRVDVELFCNNCTNPANPPFPTITVSIRATTGSPAVPTGPDLASTQVVGFEDFNAVLATATFSTPAMLTTGTRYALVLRSTSNWNVGNYAYTCSCLISGGTVNSSPYADGQRVTSSNSGTDWTPDTVVEGGRDLHFVTYINSYLASATYVSSLKDANPAAGETATWGLLFSGSAPTGTDVRFQIAASNSNTGPFSFVGPNGTASTFFTTNGPDLGQFYGFRYLKYKAFLTSSVPTLTPTLTQVQVCYENLAGPVATSTSLSSTANPSKYSQSVSFTATVSSSAGTPTGTVQFKIGGVNFGAPVAVDGTGNAVSGSTTTLAVGNRAISAVYSGAAGFATSTGTLSQAVTKANVNVSVTSNKNPVRKGRSITFTVTVGPTAPATATPGGKVRLFVNGSAVGTKHSLVGGHASYTFTWTLGKGTFSITSRYLGNANFNAQTSAPYSQVVTK